MHIHFIIIDRFRPKDIGVTSMAIRNNSDYFKKIMFKVDRQIDNDMIFIIFEEEPEESPTL
jgi:hypothetical protein